MNQKINDILKKIQVISQENSLKIDGGFFSISDGQYEITISKDPDNPPNPPDAIANGTCKNGIGRIWTKECSYAHNTTSCVNGLLNCSHASNAGTCTYS